MDIHDSVDSQDEYERPYVYAPKPVDNDFYIQLETFDTGDDTNIIISNEDPQQSFLFGADNNLQRNRVLAKNIEQTADYVIPTTTQTNWVLVFRHWVLSSIALPLYVIALVTKSWKDNPGQLRKTSGLFVIILSIVFYGMLLTSVAFYGSNQSIRQVFPPQHIGLVCFVYLLCCFAESMLKHTKVITKRDNITISTSHAETADPSCGKGERCKVQTLHGNTWSITTFLETISFISSPSQRQQKTPFFISLAMSLLYAAGVTGLQILFVKGNATNVSAMLVVYVIFETIVSFFLCFGILFTLSHVALRLLIRRSVVSVFKEATTTSQGDHSFRLYSLNNVKAWHTIRESLIGQFGFPSIYVDVVVSAAFTLWIPLVMIAVLEFLFQAQVTLTAMMAAILAIEILMLLIVCVGLASNVQDVLFSTETLRKHEFNLLVNSQNANSAEQTKITKVLGRLSQLIEQDRDNAVIFQVWGFTLNKRMVIFLGGVLVTLLSSVMVKLGSKLTN